MSIRNITRTLALAVFAFMLVPGAAFATPIPMDNNDQIIKQEIVQAMGEYGQGLEVVVNNGRVKLIGNVDSDRELSYVENKARQVAGVRSVNTTQLGYDLYFGIN